MWTKGPPNSPITPSSLWLHKDIAVKIRKRPLRPNDINIPRDFPDGDKHLQIAV